MAVVITGNNTPTAGGITYGDGTTYATTTAGTSGQLLQSNGASAPSWVAAPSSAMTLISTQTASNSASIDFTGLSTTYKNYLVLLDWVVPSTEGAQFAMRFSTDNGATFISTSTYNWADLYGVNPNGGNGTNSFGYLTPGGVASTASLGGLNATITLYNPNASAPTMWSVAGVCYDTSVFGATISFMGGGAQTGANSVNAIRFLFGAGNITSGTIKLYGIS